MSGGSTPNVPCTVLLDAASKTLPDDPPERVKKYRSSKWHYRQRKIISELFMHFIADTDTDENYFEINFS